MPTVQQLYELWAADSEFRGELQRSSAASRRPLRRPGANGRARRARLAVAGSHQARVRRAHPRAGKRSEAERGEAATINWIWFARVLRPGGAAVVTTLPVGLSQRSADRLGTEWRESMIESGAWDTGADLRALVRLDRHHGALVERYGEAAVEAAWGGVVWGVYQVLGKLCPTVYVWTR